MSIATPPLHPSVLTTLPAGVATVVTPPRTPILASVVAPSVTTATSADVSDATTQAIASAAAALDEARQASHAAAQVVAQRQAALVEAQAAVAARRVACAAATTAAQALADQAIRSGHDTTRQKRAQDKSLLAAFKAQADIAAGEATISAMQSDLAAAHAAQRAASEQLALRDAALANAQADAARDALHSEWETLTAQLLDLARRSRAHNTAVAGQGSAPGMSSRAANMRRLVLPGDPARRNPVVTADAKQGARQGVALRLAPDLCRFDISEHAAIAGM